MAENWEGYDEILKVLRTLGDDKKINELLKKTNRDLITPVQKDLKTALPYPSSLKKEIRIRAATVNGTKHPNAIMVGPTSDVFPIRFLEKGTIERYNKKGAYRGKITGKHALEPFLDSKASELQKKAPELYGESLVKITEKEVKRISKKK